MKWKWKLALISKLSFMFHLMALNFVSISTILSLKVQYLTIFESIFKCTSMRNGNNLCVFIFSYFINFSHTFVLTHILGRKILIPNWHSLMNFDTKFHWNGSPSNEPPSIDCSNNSIKLFKYHFNRSVDCYCTAAIV